MQINKIYHGDCLEVMKGIPDKSIDCIVTDPPYEYLKHKLDRIVDNKQLHIEEYKRILKDDAAIVMFGRGTAFYDWNVKIADNGFNFKEEIIWNKTYNSNMFGHVMRIHETISLHTRGDFILNKVYVDYENENRYKTIIHDVKRVISGLKGKEKKEIIAYIENDFEKDFKLIKSKKHRITSAHNGIGSVTVNTLNKFFKGFIERSIIDVSREHYSMEHPTQKPLALMERLIRLVQKDTANFTILDPFAGSGTTCIAALNLGLQTIGIELDEEYYKMAKRRIQSWHDKNEERIFKIGV